MSEENLPYDHSHPIYDLGECVLVSTTGEYVVRNGKVTEVSTEIVTGRVMYVYNAEVGHWNDV